MALHYLRGFLPMLLQYGDLAAARRNGHLHVVIAQKNRARRLALKGRR